MHVYTWVWSSLVSVYFIFIVLASNYSFNLPRFYGNKGIILNQWTAKCRACPINPEQQVLFIPMVPLNTEITPIDRSFQDWPRHERRHCSFAWWRDDVSATLVCGRRRRCQRECGTEVDEGAGRGAGTQGALLTFCPLSCCLPGVLPPHPASSQGYAGSQGGSSMAPAQDGLSPSPLSSCGWVLRRARVSLPSMVAQWEHVPGL